MDECRATATAPAPLPGRDRTAWRRDLAGPLRRLVAGQCLGQCADGLAQLAFAQFVLFTVGRGATPGRIAAVLAVTLLPFSVVGPFAGLLLDRFDRRRALVAVSLLRALLVLGGVAAVAARSIPAAFAGMVLLLASSRLVLVAKGAALPRTVPRERLVPANAFSAVAGTVAAFTGAVGGSQLAGLSTAGGFLGASLLYVAAAAAFARLPGLGGGRAPGPAPLLPRLGRTLRDLAEGARTAAATPQLRRPLLCVAAHRLLLGAGFVVLVLVADSQYRLKVAGYGLALAVTGVAALAGSLAAPPLAARYGAAALVPAAFPPAAAAAYVAGLVPSLPVLLVCVGVVALAFQALKVATDALVGGGSPDAVRGRVFALYDLLYNVAFVAAGLAMVPWWHPGAARPLLWWIAAGFAAVWVVTGHGARRAEARPRPWGVGAGPGPSLPVGEAPVVAGRAGRRWRGRWAAAAAGALTALAFPGPSWWWWAWCALVPLMLLVRAAPTRREGMVRAWWGAGAMVAATQYWLLPSIGPALLLLAALLGALWLPWGWAVHRLLGAPPTPARTAGALLAVPGAWTCAEAVRSWQSLGGPWALLGATQWNQPAMLASASLGGVWLTGFLIVAAGTAAVVAITSPGARRRATALLVAAGCAAVGPAWALLRPGLPSQRTVRIAVVQPGVVASPQAREAAEEALTTAVARRRPDLVVWAESSVSRDLAVAPGLLARLRALSRTAGADLLVNVDARREAGAAGTEGRPGIFKQSVLIGPSGVLGRYDKVRLVPFGEYIPLRPLLGWTALISRAAAENRLRGHDITVMRSGPLTVGPLVCFESAFPDMARNQADRGAQLIVYQTATSTFQGSWAQPQHAALAAVRAAETGRPVVHAGLTGVSAAFDAEGRRLAWQGASYRGAFVVAVPLVSGTTPYRTAGDWVLALAFTALAGAVTAATVGPRRRGAAESLQSDTSGPRSDDGHRAVR